MTPAASASMAVMAPVGLAALCSSRVAAALRSVGCNARQLVAADAFGRAKSMRRYAWRGRARLRAHPKWTKSLYLQSPRVYFDEREHGSPPHAQVLSDTTENAPCQQGERGSSARDGRRASCWAGHTGSTISRGVGDAEPERQAQEAPTGMLKAPYFFVAGKLKGLRLGVHLYIRPPASSVPSSSS